LFLLPCSSSPTPVRLNTTSHPSGCQPQCHLIDPLPTTPWISPEELHDAGMARRAHELSQPSRLRDSLQRLGAHHGRIDRGPGAGHPDWCSPHSPAPRRAGSVPSTVEGPTSSPTSRAEVLRCAARFAFEEHA
jgi:hypothetical protein